MTIEIKSFNQILGGMVRKIIAETPLSDVNPGSVFLSLLEACASQDFDNNVAILSILELLNVDAIRNNDLDNKAADLGLERIAATAATGVIQIKNTNITKQSTSLYSLKPAPISGQTVLYVNDTDGWDATGNLYIGRGTNSFEGPIPYTSITVFATYSQITLGAALQKDHLSSDTVINAQGQPDRIINAGTIVKIPANNQNSEILYNTIRDAVIPAGEDSSDDILVVCQSTGTQGNALINTINQFDVTPFIGAAVTNTVAFSTGQDIETDVELRNRIKAYTSSLARGTSAAILSAVVGLSDQDENKRVASAVLSQPVSIGDPSILYIDDGQGFQPSQAGQTVDVLVSKANGTEEFLQLANYPLPRAQVINGASGPFIFFDQMFLRVSVDSVEETIIFETADFNNISVATLPEIVSAINDKSTLFKARLTENSSRILIFPVDPDAETIQVIDLRDSDNENLYANNLLNFSVKEASYIALFQNSVRLRQKQKTATVETVPYAFWNILSSGNLLVSVDGTPVQDATFALTDFENATSFALLTIDDWVTAINNKIAGITANTTPNQTIQISSNKTGSSATLEILGGSYQEQMFNLNSISSVGQESQFEINRSTGNIRLLTTIESGDIISAGIEDAKGFVVSTAAPAGTFNFDIDDNGRQSQMIICADCSFCNSIPIQSSIGQSFIFTNIGGGILQIITTDFNTFQYVQPGHFIYVTYRDGDSSWVSTENSGIFKVVRKDSDLSNSWIEVINVNINFDFTVLSDKADFIAFETDVYPQLWTSSFLTNPLSASLSDVVDSINNNLIGVKASIFRTNSIKITSTTEDSGSIAIPVSVGVVSTIFPATSTRQVNNAPLIANKTSAKDMLGFIKFQPIISGNSYLDRANYPGVFASLSSNVIPDSYPYSAAYSESLTASLLTETNVDLSDILFFPQGSNTGLLRSIAAQTATTTLGTQQGLPRTIFDHIINDKIQVYNSLRLAQDDNIVVILDQDPAIKTITIPVARTGQINSGSDSLSFIPNSTEFSANDNDTESGVDFSTTNVWGTDINKTDFADYDVLMRARNWYASGGTGSSAGKFIIRAVEYGVNGNLLRFSIEYPESPNSDNLTVLSNTPSFNTLVYKFGSGSDRAIAITSGDTIDVTGPYSDESVNFPAGASDGPSGKYFDLTWNAGDLSTVQVNDVLSTFSGCGWSSVFLGQYGVKAKSGNIIRIYNPDGVVSTQTVNSPALIHIFPLQNTTVGEILDKVSESNILVGAAVSSTSASILVSTWEDQYTYSNDATALGHGHDPTDADLQGYVGLFDGVANVRAFSNDNPNFTLKKALILPDTGVSSLIYRMDTAPNEDSTNGEYIKLVPTTIKNVKHHFTQKALSQLPIVADVSISNNGRRVQIVSKELGGNGAIEILGGQANKAQTSVIGQSVAVSDINNSYLLGNIAAFPSTYMKGDVVKITNPYGVARATQFASSSTISVTALVSDRAEYYWNPITTNFVAATTFTITDVSSLYNDYSGNPLAAGVVWRWTHSTGNGETLSLAKPGQQVIAYNCPSWNNTNLAKLPGDGSTVGLTIIAVDETNNFFDVVNPFGIAMSATAISTGTVMICPVPRNKWNVKHSAPASINSMERASNVITVQTSVSHDLNTGDNVIINNSLNVIADGTYGPVTVVGPQTFTFSNAGADIIELNIGATALKSTKNQSYYYLEKVGINNLVRISLVSGDSPRFADCGVAVDDYLVLSGKTFNSMNNGVYRVIAVDNSSIVFEHENAIESITLTVPFNYNSIEVDWSANSASVTGVAGSFENLYDGIWVKKSEDSDDKYVEVIGNNTSNYQTATVIYLRQSYVGTTSSSTGVAYDMSSGYNSGVALIDPDDITIYEGDSAFITDKLNVQTITNTNWFNANNTGQFDIIEIGNNPGNYRPFVRVNNDVAVTEANRALSVAPQGFYIIEDSAYKYSTYRTVVNSVIDDTNNLQRNLYMLPDSRAYKIADSNDSVIQHMGKMGFDLLTAVGEDGYLFYTGLLRRVQRTIDGYDPDPITYAERRAIGSRIETLPPLIKNISLVLTITTNEGSTIQDVSNNVKSSIIDYVNNLGVGDDVILSAIIAAIMKVKGIAAVTFNTPDPSTERITIASNEKALISADMIGIA